MAFFKNLWTFLTETIFLKDERNYRNGLIRWGVRQYKLLFYTARGLDEHDTLVRSAALTFYTLMSIVPIAALVFAVVKGFGLADGLMQNLYSLFPHNREVVDYLITFADKALAAAQGGVVAFVGIVMLFWAVVRVFGSVEEAFNNIWEVKVSRSFTRQFTDYIAVVVITPILWVVGSTAGRYAGHLLSVLHFDILLLFDAPLPFVLYFSLKLMPLPRQTVLSDFPQPDCKTLVHRDPSQEHTYPPYIYQALWEIHPSFFLLPDYIWD